MKIPIPPRTTAVRALAAAVLGSLVFLSACGVTTTGSPSGSGPGAGAPTPTSPSAASSSPFKVSSVSLAVSPSTIAGSVCGTEVTFTYTATFDIPAGTGGGAIHFMYTLNNGRSSSNASVTVPAGQTSATYAFTSSGTLPSDHTYPGIAEVVVTSPNPASSPQVQVAGSCTTGGAFKVTSVGMAVSPGNISGYGCGTTITVVYTATFHLAPGGPGGTIHFMYTLNNGRGSSNASVNVAPGQATATYTFNWSGPLPADHTYPGLGGVITSSPNMVSSPLVQPTGTCS